MSEVNPQKLIAAMVQKGMTVPEIAAFMKITQAEVKKYVTPQQAPASARHQRDHITPKATVADHKQNNQSFDDLLSEMSKIIDGNKPRQTGKGPATSTVQPKAPNPNKPASTVSFSAQQQALYDQDDTDGRGLFNSISDRLKRSRGPRDTDQGRAPDRLSARFFNSLDDRANRNWRRLPLSRTGNVLKATGGLLNKAAAAGTASFLNKELGVLGHVMTHRIGWLRKGREFSHDLHHLKHHYGLKDKNIQDFMDVHGDPHYFRGRGGKGGFDPKSVQSLVLAIDTATSKVVDHLRETTDLLRRIRIDDDSGLNQNPNAKVMGGLEEKKGGILKRVGLGVAGLGLAGLLASLFSSSAEAHNLGPVTGGDDLQPTRTNPDAPSPELPAQEQPTQEDQAAKENVEQAQENAEQNAPQPTKNDELTFKADKIVFDADDIEFVNKNGGTNAQPQAQTPAGALGGQKGKETPKPAQTPNAAPGASQGAQTPPLRFDDPGMAGGAQSGGMPGPSEGISGPSQEPSVPMTPPSVGGADAAGGSIPVMTPQPKASPPTQSGPVPVDPDRTQRDPIPLPPSRPSGQPSQSDADRLTGDEASRLYTGSGPNNSRVNADGSPQRNFDALDGQYFDPKTIKPEHFPYIADPTKPIRKDPNDLGKFLYAPSYIGDDGQSHYVGGDPETTFQKFGKLYHGEMTIPQAPAGRLTTPMVNPADSLGPDIPQRLKPVEDNRDGKVPSFLSPENALVPSPLRTLNDSGDKLSQLSTEMNDPVQMASLATPNQSTSNPNPFSTNGFGANMRDDPPSTFHADHFSDVPGLNRSGREEGIGA
jgi:hypothetical protein